MSRALAARRDDDDIRRLAELGITALDWRRTPAKPKRSVVVESDEPGNPTLISLVKSLVIGGHAVTLRPTHAFADRVAADALVVRFESTTPASTAVTHNGITLPALSQLRSSVADKRKAWSALRASLRH